MGQNTFMIKDGCARFGEELPRKPAKRLQLHFVLSESGAEQLCNAVSSALERERQSHIIIPCRCHAQSGKRFIWYRQFEMIFPAIDDLRSFEVIRSGGVAQLVMHRADADVVYDFCNAMKDGLSDVAYKLGDSMTLWVWGNGLGP